MWSDKSSLFLINHAMSCSGHGRFHPSQPEILNFSPWSFCCYDWSSSSLLPFGYRQEWLYLGKGRSCSRISISLLLQSLLFLRLIESGIYVVVFLRNRESKRSHHSQPRKEAHSNDNDCDDDCFGIDNHCDG